MITREFTLDFTGQSGVPSQWGITVPQVVKWFTMQSKDVPGVQLTNDRKRGVFNVTALSKDAGTFLSTFKLKAEKDGKKIEIPLKEKRKRGSAVWASINRTCDGEMTEVPNAYFDAHLQSQGATILEPTKRRKHRASNLLNGQREVLIEIGEKHLARQQLWVSDDGKENHEWQISYRGQPFKCRNCDEWHADGKCPRWVDRKEEGKPELKHKHLFFSTSLLRHATDTANVRFDVIPGAKIGHLANHIDNDATILPNAEVIVVMAGQNMAGDDFAQLKVAVKRQAEELVKVLRPYAETAEKAIFIVDPAVDLTPDGPEGDEPRFLRAEMKRCADAIGAGYIPLDHLDFGSEDMDDEVHFSAKGTKRVLTAINNNIKNAVQKDVLGDFKVQDRSYSAVKAHHFKVGCYRCSFVHPGASCLPLIVEPPTSPLIPTPPQPRPPPPPQQPHQSAKPNREEEKRRKRQEKQRLQHQQLQQAGAGAGSPAPAEADRVTSAATTTATTTTTTTTTQLSSTGRLRCALRGGGSIEGGEKWC